MDKDFVLSKARDWAPLIPQNVSGKPFAIWLEANFHVWERFAKEANNVWARGFTHYSARTILEFLRHETSVRETGSRWKLNDQAAPAMARLWAYLYPEKPLFELREHRQAA